MVGLDGLRSGLFFDMLITAQRAGAHTVVGENVPYLLSVNKGSDFERLLGALSEGGYPYISWRVLNARQFGLPQERNRVFIVASKHREVALSLHAAQPESSTESLHPAPRAAAFYWTAGGRSICYSIGYTPTLKIGASDGKGRSVVAVFCDGVASKVSAHACLRLQGFDPTEFAGESKTDIVRMAGNAVPVPMGSFVLRSVFAGTAGQIRFRGTGTPLGFGRCSDAGFFHDGAIWAVHNLQGPLANNLDDFISGDLGEPLSSQASAGLIVRTIRSGKAMPPDLFEALWVLSHSRTSYRGSRSNSFTELDQIDVAQYRQNLASGLFGLRQGGQEEAMQPGLFAS
jgi:DNA (cytosine-5)-methyltransferase 1